jgi:alpha-methylacyl-CoA racemase
LAGVKVVEVAGIGPVPFAGMVLSDLGAEVTRIDRTTPGALDELSTRDPTHRGRRSIAVDLKHQAGREVALRLAAAADIFIEGFRPGVAERLGIGPADCHRRHPALVYGRITGWGQTGPRAATAGHDINYLAISGTLSAIGPPEAPRPPLNLIADYGGGAMLLVVGVLAALDHARRSGLGQVVDAAMVDGAALLTAMIHGGLAAGWWEDRRGVNLLDGAAPFYRTYPTADGRFVAVGALEPAFFAEMIERLGLDPDELPAQYDRDRWGELAGRLAAVFASRTQAEWDELFAGTDGCVSPVRSLTEAPGEPHLADRRTFVEVAGIVQPAPAPRFSVTPAASPGGPVARGRDSEEILRALGYREGDIIKLLDDGVVTGPAREE